VAFCEKFGIPYIHGKTTASYNSIEWQQMLSAMQTLGSDGSMLTNEGAKLEFISPPATSNNPQEALVDRFDRTLARLWRGADLSTMSRSGSGTGALPQIQNEDELAEADAIKVSEACNFYIDRYVGMYLFGTQKLKAYFRVIPPLSIDTAKEIAVDQFLVSMGAKLGLNDAMERYGRRQVDEKPDGTPSEAILIQPAAPPLIGKGIGDEGLNGPLSLGNVAASALRSMAIRELSAEQAKALVPFVQRIRVCAQIDDQQNRENEAALIKKDLPTIFKGVSDRSGELATALTDIIDLAVK